MGRASTIDSSAASHSRSTATGGHGSPRHGHHSSSRGQGHGMHTSGSALVKPATKVPSRSTSTHHPSSRGGYAPLPHKPTDGIHAPSSRRGSTYMDLVSGPRSSRPSYSTSGVHGTGASTPGPPSSRYVSSSQRGSGTVVPSGYAPGYGISFRHGTSSRQPSTSTAMTKPSYTSSSSRKPSKGPGQMDTQGVSQIFWNPDGSMTTYSKSHTVFYDN